MPGIRMAPRMPEGGAAAGSRQDVAGAPGSRHPHTFFLFSDVCLQRRQLKSAEHVTMREEDADQDRKGSRSQTPSLDWLKILMAKSRVIVVGFGVLTTSRLWVGFPQASTSKARKKYAWYWLDLWCGNGSDTRGLQKFGD